MGTALDVQIAPGVAGTISHQSSVEWPLAQETSLLETLAMRVSALELCWTCPIGTPIAFTAESILTGLAEGGHSQVLARLTTTSR